jgi:LysR family glycine cleavage system transcriptional activator
MPFAEPRLASRSYCTYVPLEKLSDDTVMLFRAWLEDEGKLGGQPRVVLATLGVGERAGDRL